jgi:glutamate--cysteine ligase
MSREQEANLQPIGDPMALVEFFESGSKTREGRLIGTETEKFVVRRSTSSMLSFEEAGGFGDLFAALAKRFDWELTPADEGHVVALTGPKGAVTLEPGGQLELSGAPLKTIFETAHEFDLHMAELSAVADPDLIFTMWGMNPCVIPDDVPWMPKSRYRIMRDYLPTRGDMAHWMMKTTCTIQANYDFCSESDAVDLIHTAVLASPVVGALFANSPILGREPSGMQSTRNYIWTRTDPDRTGVPPFMYRRDWGFRDYLEYVLDVPMFFIRRDDRYINTAGYSFRRFLESGFECHRATLGDFELHLSTLFPDVRLKRFVEVRSADGGTRGAVLALPALWKGLLYDDDARKATADLFHPLDEDAHRALIQIAYTDGIHGTSAFGEVFTLAAALVDIAASGLERIARRDGHPSEAPFLTPLRERLDERRSFADLLLASFQETRGDLAQLATGWPLNPQQIPHFT